MLTYAESVALQVLARQRARFGNTSDALANREEREGESAVGCAGRRAARGGGGEERE